MDVSQHVKAFYEKILPLNKELGEWIKFEEDRLQRDLTEKEIDTKFHQLCSKYNINPDEQP